MRTDLLRATLARSVQPIPMVVRDAVEGACGATHENRPARIVQRVAATVAGLAALPVDLANAGVASVTAGLPSPALPAASLGALYVGLPHAHTHPPSAIPPAPPVPLPSVGALVLGGCPHVLIRGLPALRAGDLGLAPTCGGFAPLVEVITGSSKVFIGGARAARAGDLAAACQSSSAPHGVGAMDVIGGIAMASGAVADAGDAVAAGPGAMADALSLAVGMAATQLAVDAAVRAARAAQGTDPAIGPSLGAVVTGQSTVLIGGLPMPDAMAACGLLLAKLRARRAARHTADGPEPRCCAGHPDC